MSNIPFQFRRDTAANWTANNPVLREGEYGYETDLLGTASPQYKVGDGVTAWTLLAYITGGGTGDVVGPASSVDGELSLFDGITGKLLKTGVLASTLAPLAGPALTGVPTTPTAAPGTNNTQIASTAYADAGLALKANIASPTFTGVPAGPTAAPGTNTTQLATTAFVEALGALKAALASPTFTGTPAGPTAAPGTNTTQLATTAFAAAIAALKADLASPTFTGVPAGPTAAVGTNTTQMATTAFVHAKDPNDRPLTWGGSGTLRLSPFLGSTTGARISLAPTNDRLHYLIGRPIGRVRVSNPSVEIVTANASTMCRVGLCEWDAANGQAGALLVDWGTANTTSTGTIGGFSNGSATVDLDPNKAYAIMFIAGGGTASSFYYPPFAPSSVPLFVQGVTPMIISIYDSAEGTQRTAGFNNPPSLFAALTVETAASATGWRNFVMLEVIPTP